MVISIYKCVCSLWDMCLYRMSQYLQGKIDFRQWMWVDPKNLNKQGGENPEEAP